MLKNVHYLYSYTKLYFQWKLSLRKCGFLKNILATILQAEIYQVS